MTHHVFQESPLKTVSLPSRKLVVLSLQVMKILPALTIALSSMAGAFDIPKGSHNLGQLEETQKKAVQAKQPIAFVIAKKNMTAT